MALSGDLDEFPLTELLQILAMSRKSGTLELTGDVAAGRLVLAAGRLLDARTADVTGETAFFLLMTNRSGPFVFSVDDGSRPAEPMPTISRSLQDLLMDASYAAEPHGERGAGVDG